MWGKKLGNGWKLVDCCYVEFIALNVTVFLDITLKFINLDQGNKDQGNPSAITILKDKKINTLEQCVTVNHKDTRTTSGASIVNFEHNLLFILQ